MELDENVSNSKTSLPRNTEPSRQTGDPFNS